MTLIELVPLILKISVGVVVFCLAMSASRGDLVYLLRRPSLLARSLLSMNIVMPFIAAVIAGAFRLRPELEMALILLAVSPVPPALPNTQAKAGANVSYAIGLVMVSALAAIVLVPVLLPLIARAFGRTADVPMALIARVVVPSVIVPLIGGMIVQRVAPSFAERWAKPVSKVGTVMLVLAFVPVVIGSRKAIVDAIADFTVVAIVLFTLASLLVGHLLGGPDPEDRTVLALSTAKRHPAVAMAVASAVAQDKQAIAATLLLAILVSSIVVAPYVTWRKKARPR